MRLVVYYDRGMKRYGLCTEERMKIHQYEDEIPVLITTSEPIARAVRNKLIEEGVSK